MDKLSYKYKYEKMKKKYLQLKKLKGGNTDIISRKSILVGKGSYGCVFSPPLKCYLPDSLKSKFINGISKLMNSNFAIKALTAFCPIKPLYPVIKIFID